MGLFGKSKKEKEQEYMNTINIEKCMKEDFSLTVEDVFLIVGVGTVVTGTVSTGMCRVGETATIANYETVITTIDVHTKYRRSDGVAFATEHVGLGLRGITKEQVKIGDVVKVKNEHN
ncbi:MAG: hypothetical protein HUJ98_14225 [Bacteroidaceae bacterium]|nr:hypothetical protein [Bacteroidaceae bacterium]